MITGKVEGLDQIKRQIAKLERKARQGGPLDVALSNAADMFVAEARRRVPVKTGKLRDSIKRRRSGTGFRVKPTAKYAATIEFGTRNIEAQPYMRPAFDEVAPKAREAIAEHMRKDISSGT